jgi:hypothetical protein
MRIAHIAAVPALFALLTTSCQTSASPTAAAVQPTFADIQQKIFSSNCTTRSCHGDAGRGGLVLTPDVAYANLINVPAQNDAAKPKGKKRVIPGDPTNSFLLQKLTGPAADEGDLMPQRGGSLSATDIEAIRLWIANGAKP